MLTAVQVRETQLPTTFMRQAYNQSQVNDLIDRIAATLRQMMPVLIATTKQLSSQLSLCAKQPTLMC